MKKENFTKDYESNFNPTFENTIDYIVNTSVCKIRREASYFLVSIHKENENIINLQANEISKLQAENERLKSEVAAWKNNHAEMVKRNAALRDRPDMPTERVQAVQILGHENENLRHDITRQMDINAEVLAEIEELKLIVERYLTA